MSPAMASGFNSVCIRPGVTVLSVLRHLNYQPWFALAEFVDNSIQSHLDSKQQLKRIHGNKHRLRVTIELDSKDSGRLTIRDNAAGIDAGAYPRAFRPAALPPDVTGLCEFGMGMKSAACWFSPQWSVRTSALGESIERTVHFNIETIVRDEIDELYILEENTKKESHYTEIVLSHLYKPPQKRTLGKIKDHLTDIYRVFTRTGDLDLYFNGERLTFEEPEVLLAPYYKEPEGQPVRWRKDISLDFGTGYQVRGFAAIRKTGDTARAGFSLFRRGRLIQGSADNGYRPPEIFGSSNSYMYQRIFGELHLEGFEVSHTKDGFRWNESEEVFLDCLKEVLQDKEFPLLQQAREYRTKRSRQEYKRGAVTAVTRTAEVIEKEGPSALEDLSSKPSVGDPRSKLEKASTASSKTVHVNFRGQAWRIDIELTDDPAIGDWLEISEKQAPRERGEGRLGLRMSLCHPFMERFGGIDVHDIEPLLRVAAAIGLGEVLARQSGVKFAGTVRRNMNELLRTALSRA